MLLRLDETLREREKRYLNNKLLSNLYKLPLINVMLNNPLIEKDTKECILLHNKEIKQVLKCLEENEIREVITRYTLSIEGPSLTLLVDYKDAINLKKLMIKIEKRHYDIDVYDSNFNQITREMLNLPLRKCFLCDLPAKICIKKREHSYDELKTYFSNLLK